jgi:hypothetical protein
MFNVGFIVPALLLTHLYTPSDCSFADNCIVLEDEDDAAAAVPSVWVSLLPFFASAAMCIEFYSN